MKSPDHTQPGSVLATLESAANLLLSAVAPTISRLVRVDVEICDEADTAATDGSIFIRMPTRFCDESVADNVSVAVGLLVHEIGHFLQPLEEIDAVEKAEQIPHWLTNVVLDIQGEALLETLFPSFRKPLAAVRRVVGRNRLAVYESAIGKASTFREAAVSLALWGRFAEPEQPFTAGRLAPKIRKRSSATRFVRALDEFRHCPAWGLPQKLAALIGLFPELRGSSTSSLSDELDGVRVSRSGSLQAALAGEAFGNVADLAGGGFTAPIQQVNHHAEPYRPAALGLSRALRTRFMARSSGIEILAPGRFHRRSSAREEVPLRMALPGRERPAPSLVLCVDASGSMNDRCAGSAGRSKWDVAQIAAQAVALSVEAAGGSVVGLIFADEAWTTPQGNALPLTVARGTSTGIVGTGTCFAFLTEVWRRYPGHQVLVLTDGHGGAPFGILPGDRERTHAIIIPKGHPHLVRSWSQQQVVLNDLRRLAQVLAMLVPRADLA